MRKATETEAPACCPSCRWWKCLSATSTSVAKACHLLLETGRRNGRHGDICATWERREPVQHEDP